MPPWLRQSRYGCAQYGDVGRRVAAREGRGRRAAVGQTDFDVVVALDYMVRGDYRAVR